MPSKKLVLVTGASGFVGAQVVDHLLKAGYSVRGTSRSAKADSLRRQYTNPDFDVTVLDDLIGGDFSAAFKGVSAILHVASPLVSGSNHIEVAVEGTLNLLRQAHASKIYKITIISSFAAAFTNGTEMFDPSRTINDKDWNETTKKEAQQPEVSLWAVYAASKALAERAVWDFVDSHPDMDIVTLLPPFIYGPIAPAQVVKNLEMLSTNGFIYSLISGKTAAYPSIIPPQCVDVRDVAKASVLSLNTKPALPGERRRILLWGGSFTWKQAAKHIRAVRPDLKSRLIDGGEVTEAVTSFAKLDLSKAEEVLGLTEFIGWKQTVEDVVDSLLKREAAWAK